MSLLPSLKVLLNPILGIESWVPEKGSFCEEKLIHGKAEQWMQSSP